jgi:hypothetical protein
MKIVKVELEGIPGSPYSQSAQHGTDFLERESHEDYDIRTWRDKCTVNEDGQVCIPAMALKQCIDTAAFKIGLKVPNRRGATYKSFFASGFICNGDVPISNGKALTPDNAVMVKINANADGRRGSGSRVPRRFPEFSRWHGTAEFTILDDIITQDIFEQHVKAGGLIVGIGRFRPENGGKNGRFRAVKFQWEDFII